MAKHENLTALFTAIADSIRGKTGGTDAIIADDFPEAIDGIQTGGGVDKIQRYIELQGNSAANLFNGFGGTSIGDLMDGVDMSNVTNVTNMFYSCTALTSVPLFDTSSITTMGGMFNVCRALTSVPLFDTRNAVSINGMFSNCSALTSVPSFDIRNVTLTTGMFTYCNALTECWVRNIKTDLQVGSYSSWGHLLTLESLLHLCKECRNTGSSLTLTIGTANLTKLEGIYVKFIDITDDMRAEDDLIDEKYPFVQCESTDEGAMTIQEYMATKMWSLA